MNNPTLIEKPDGSVFENRNVQDAFLVFAVDINASLIHRVGPIKYQPRAMQRASQEVN